MRGGKRREEKQRGGKKEKTKKQRRERGRTERREKPRGEKNIKKKQRKEKQTERREGREEKEDRNIGRKGKRTFEIAAAPPGAAVRELRHRHQPLPQHRQRRTASSAPGNFSSHLILAFIFFFVSFPACRTSSVLHAGVGGK
jgi:hypothetical protein